MYNLCETGKHRNIPKGKTLYIYMPEKGQSPYPDMPDIHIGEAGVLKLLNNINSHNAIGPDGIPARLMFVTQDDVSVVMIHPLTMDDMF
jgi:hypothetical protein